MGHCSSSPSPSTKGHGGEICRIPFPHCFIRFYGSILLLDHVRLLPDYLFHGYSLHFVCVRPFSSLTSNTSPTRFLLQVQHTRAQSAVVLFQPFFFSVLEVVLCKFKGRVENKPGTYKNRNKHENYLRWLFKEMEINSLLWGPKKKKKLILSTGGDKIHSTTTWLYFSCQWCYQPESDEYKKTQKTTSIQSLRKGWQVSGFCMGQGLLPGRKLLSFISLTDKLSWTVPDLREGWA